MRRVTVLLLAGGLAGGLAFPAGAADYTPRRMKAAQAMWLIPTGEPHVFTGYFVNAWLFRDFLADRTYSVAFIDKGTCRVKITKQATLTICIGDSGDSAFARPSDEAFQVDPALRSASLKVRADRRTLSVQWTGNDPGGSGLCGYGFQSSDGQSDQGYCLYQDAEATGHLFGDVVSTTHRFDTAWFGYGADTPPQPEVRVLHGRTVFTVRVPRH